MRSRHHRRTAGIAAGLAAGALLLAACSGTASSTAPSGSANPGGLPYELTANTPAPTGDIDSFTWSLYAEPVSLSFAYAFDYPPNTILSNVCESLLRWNADLSTSPGLATKVDNPTPTTWVYTIRQGVKFHDGTTMTADDVVASLKYHLDPKVGSYWASVFEHVKSIAKTGADQVTVTLTQPDSQFNKYMAATPGTVESAATLAKDGADYGNPSKGVNCTGPFEFSSWTPGQSIVLKKFAGYWDPQLAPKASQVKFVFLVDPATRVNGWLSGEVDGGWLIPTSSMAQLNASGKGKLYYGVNTSTTSEIVTNLNGPLGKVEVRQALLQATDRAGIIAAGLQGYGEIANALAPKSVWVGVPQDQVDAAYAGLPTYPYDVNAAKALAEKAGVNGQKITIATIAGDPSSNVTTQAVTAAAKAIGLDPTVQTIDANKYTALFSDPAARKGIDLMITNWYLSTGDPLEMYGVLRTGQFSNYGNWSDPAYDAATNKAIATADPAERAKYSAQAQLIAAQQLPWLPMNTTPTSLWLGSRITGVAPSIYYMYFPWAATIGAAS